MRASNSVSSCLFASKCSLRLFSRSNRLRCCLSPMLSGGARLSMGTPVLRSSVPWKLAGKKPALQFFAPPMTSPGSVKHTKVGRFSLGEPSAVFPQESMEGRPARIEAVFIWHIDPTWFNPSAQQPLKTDILSTCFAISGYQSETQMPLCPCCLKVRSDGMMALLPVPIAVVTVPNDAGIGLPASDSRAGLGSNVSTWLGPPSMNSQMTDFAVGAK